MVKQKPRLLIIDGHSLAFRAFFALPVESFVNSAGQHTNAVQGFINMLARLLDTEKPTHAAVAFDLPGGTFRTRQYQEYKAGRGETPAEFPSQISYITQLLAAMRISAITVPDFEADDILATLSRQGTEAGFEVLVVTGDRDSIQLVNDQVTLLYPVKGVSELLRLNPEKVIERYGVPAYRYRELAALVGEKADNLPGVPGVGAKTAADWLNKFDGLENLLLHRAEISGKRGEALREYQAQVERNLALNKLVDDLDLGLKLDDLELQGFNLEEIGNICQELEFSQVRARLVRLDTRLRATGENEKNLSAEISETANTNLAELAGRLAHLNENVDDLPDVDLENEWENLSSLLPSFSNLYIANNFVDFTQRVWGIERNFEGTKKDKENKENEQAKMVPSIQNFPTYLHLSAGNHNDPALLYLSAKAGKQEPSVESLNLAVLDLGLLDEEESRALARYLEAEEMPKVVFDAKQVAIELNRQGYTLGGVIEDVKLAAYLASPDERNQQISALAAKWLEIDLNEIAARYLVKLDVQADEMGTWQLAPLGTSFVPLANEVKAYNQIVGPKARKTPLKKMLERISMLCLDMLGVILIPALAARLQNFLTQTKQLDLLHDLELPVMHILTQMECDGVQVDIPYLHELLADFEAITQRAQDIAQESIGHEVNLNSPQQIQKVLFTELQLEPIRKTARGYSTDAESLAALSKFAPDVPFLQNLMVYRDVVKLKQMVEGLINNTDSDGRIHTIFQQTTAATGRLASAEPNLQNIPVRSEEGRRIRKAFVRSDEFECLLTADYSQIEMRLMAHFCGDESLCAAFQAGEDLHNYVASQVFNIPTQLVTPTQRSQVKQVSYGLAYGLSAFGLSKRLGISVPQANNLMANYFARFGQVRDYLRQVVVDARQRGYTETLCGRRRYAPGISSTNRQVREAAERASLNAPIQGSAADIMKIAMLAVDAGFKDAGLKSRMLLQVHDELVIDVWPREKQAVAQIVETAMQGVVKLKVPLEVSMGVGENWAEAAH